VVAIGPQAHPEAGVRVAAPVAHHGDGDLAGRAIRQE
jgi:hypothetical protein